MNYYEILGVEKSASKKNIKDCFRKMAMRYHPDRNPDDPDAESKFKEFNEAYATLSDDTKRAAYDNHLNRGNHQHNNAFFNNIFTEFAKQQQQSKIPVYNVKLSLEDAFKGIVINVNGTDVKVPAGIRSGNRLVLDGAFLVIYVLKHNKFQRSNDDLLVDLYITAFEAIVGTVAYVTLLDNTSLKFSIDAGIQPGQIVKLQGKGMPNPEVDCMGDLLIRCNISIPNNLTTEEKAVILSLTQPRTIKL